MRWLFLTLLLMSFPAHAQRLPDATEFDRPLSPLGPRELPGANAFDRPMYQPPPSPPPVIPPPEYRPPALYDMGRGLDPDRPRVGRQRCQPVMC